MDSQSGSIARDANSAPESTMLAARPLKAHIHGLLIKVRRSIYKHYFPNVSKQLAFVRVCYSCGLRVHSDEDCHNARVVSDRSKIGIYQTKVDWSGWSTKENAIIRSAFSLWRAFGAEFIDSFYQFFAFVMHENDITDRVKVTRAWLTEVGAHNRQSLSCIGVRAERIGIRRAAIDDGSDYYDSRYELKELLAEFYPVAPPPIGWRYMFSGLNMFDEDTISGSAVPQNPNGNPALIDSGDGSEPVLTVRTTVGYPGYRRQVTHASPDGGGHDDDNEESDFRMYEDDWDEDLDRCESYPEFENHDGGEPSEDSYYSDDPYSSDESESEGSYEPVDPYAEICHGFLGDRLCSNHERYEVYDEDWHNVYEWSMEECVFLPSLGYSHLPDSSLSISEKGTRDHAQLMCLRTRKLVALSDVLTRVEHRILRHECRGNL